MERGLTLVWNKRGGSNSKMIWLGRKRASRAALTCVVNQFDVSSRTRPKLLTGAEYSAIGIAVGRRWRRGRQRDGGSRGITSEVRTDRKLLFESNQTTNKGQHLMRQQTKCKEG